MYLRSKFQVSSIVVTSFRQGVGGDPPTSKRTPKKSTQFRVNSIQQLAIVKKSAILDDTDSCIRNFYNIKTGWNNWNLIIITTVYFNPVNKTKLCFSFCYPFSAWCPLKGHI